MEKIVWSKLKVVQLRKELQARKLPLSGLKAELIKKIEDHIKETGLTQPQALEEDDAKESNALGSNDPETDSDVASTPKAASTKKPRGSTASKKKQETPATTRKSNRRKTAVITEPMEIEADDDVVSNVEMKDDDEKPEKIIKEKKNEKNNSTIVSTPKNNNAPLSQTHLPMTPSTPSTPVHQNNTASNIINSHSNAAKQTTTTTTATTTLPSSHNEKKVEEKKHESVKEMPVTPNHTSVTPSATASIKATTKNNASITVESPVITKNNIQTETPSKTATRSTKKQKTEAETNLVTIPIVTPAHATAIENKDKEKENKNNNIAPVAEKDQVKPMDIEPKKDTVKAPSTNEKQSPSRKRTREQAQTGNDKIATNNNSSDNNATNNSKRQRKWGSTSSSNTSSAVNTDVIMNVISDCATDIKSPNTPVQHHQGPTTSTQKVASITKQSNPAITTSSTTATSSGEDKMVITTGLKSKNNVLRQSNKNAVHKNDGAISSSEPQEQKREVPPAKNPVSNVIVIRELVRPFTQKNIQELLTQTGKVVDLWLNTIKSVCYVKMENEEQTILTRNAIHNLKWPNANGKLLFVDFATSNEMQQAKDSDKQKAAPLNNNKTATNTKVTTLPPAPVPEKKGPTLDDLFKKTTSKPCIYYLPLTDEQVAAKKRAKEQQQQEKAQATSAATDKNRSPVRQNSSNIVK